MKFCPICNRELGELYNEHHLIPRAEGGKNGPRIDVHVVCHRKIHSVFTEKELAKSYYTVELILENEDMKRFVKWVSKKDINYYDHSISSSKKHDRK